MENDPYQILGLKPGASEVEINRAYRSLAKLFHPDLNPNKPGNYARFNEISWARAFLSDPARRVSADDDAVAGTPI
ncbi:MAG: J domain-containing protein [Proteobacteria bacterium]|nr:J domain-containing protein [Pseudomonadota bacterium]